MASLKTYTCDGCGKDVPTFYMESGTVSAPDSQGIDYDQCFACLAGDEIAECDHLVTVDHDRPCAACLVESGDYTLNEMLGALGFETDEVPALGQKQVIQDGDVLFVGTAHEVARWLINDAELPERVEATDG